MDGMDIDEEQGHDECIDMMEKIIEEFGDLRESFFHHKLSRLRREMEELKICHVYFLLYLILSISS
jgi:hypothetical protein